tara:strand:- start:3036 stop:4034 length:999 start_codon:yes stop_codon:yes gene_type:complete
MGGIPVIDIAAFSHGDDTDRKKIAAAVAHAVETIGFLSITGHGVPVPLINRVRESAWTFFGLPLGAKLAYLDPSHNLNRGYTPYAEEHNAASAGTNAAADLREGYIFGPLELPEGIQPGTAAAHAYQPNIWPDALPDVADAFRSYYTAVANFNKTLLEIFATALDLPPDYFETKFRDHSSVVRILHYPGQTDIPEEGQLRCGAHTDFGSHTILLADDSPGGLQVLTKSGDWIDALPPANGFIINIGDMMKMWTNDRWHSNLHRVANPPCDESAGARLSIAFFTYPNPNAVIECLPTCRSDNQPAKYDPVPAGEYRRMKVNSTTAAAQTLPDA